MDQLGDEDEVMTHPKPFDIPKRRVLEARSLAMIVVNGRVCGSTGSIGM